MAEGETLHPHHRDFAAEDHFDAFAVFNYLVAKSIRQLGPDHQQVELYDLQAYNHKKAIERDVLADMKRRARIVTSIDLIHFASNLVWIGYRIDW